MAANPNLDLFAQFTPEQQELFRNLNRGRQQAIANAWIFSGTPTSNEHEEFNRLEEQMRAAQSASRPQQSPTASYQSLAFPCQNNYVGLQPPVAGSSLSPLPGISPLSGKELARPLLPDRPQFAWIHDPTDCKWHDVEVTHDTGASKNWIAPGVVRRYHLGVRSIPNLEFYDFQGGKVQANRCVTITWVGRNAMRTQQTDFLVASDKAPFTMLVGKEFVEEYGFEAFTGERVAEPAMILVQKRVTEGEKEAIAKSQAVADAQALELARKRQMAKLQTEQRQENSAEKVKPVKRNEK